MSDIHVIHGSPNPLAADEAIVGGNRSGRHGRPAGASDRTDAALDEALRSVPLPEGLLSRLGALARAIPEESLDQVDFLGC